MMWNDSDYLKPKHLRMFVTSPGSKASLKIAELFSRSPRDFVFCETDTLKLVSSRWCCKENSVNRKRII